MPISASESLSDIKLCTPNSLYTAERTRLTMACWVAHVKVGLCNRTELASTHFPEGPPRFPVRRSMLACANSCRPPGVLLVNGRK